MVEAYPLHWPEGWPRTTHPKRNYAYKATFGRYLQDLLAELKRLGGTQIVVSTNMATRRDGLPYADCREPKDSGVSVYFMRKGKQVCFACDKFDRVKDNIRAIGLTIEAIRAIERHGASDMLDRAFNGFLALPHKASSSWRDLLNFGHDAEVTDEDLSKRTKELLMQHHPDRIGGDREKYEAVIEARRCARLELASTATIQ